MYEEPGGFEMTIGSMQGSPTGDPEPVEGSAGLQVSPAYPPTRRVLCQTSTNMLVISRGMK
jgi:hypothetical protein